MTEAEAAAKGRAADKPFPLAELIKLIPQLLWIGVAVFALCLFYNPVVSAVQRGDIAKVGILSLQIEFAKREMRIFPIAKACQKLQRTLLHFKAGSSDPPKK